MAVADVRGGEKRHETRMRDGGDDEAVEAAAAVGRKSPDGRRLLSRAS